MTVGSLSGPDDVVKKTEEIELMVDSGAGATVIGPHDVKIVKANDPMTVFCKGNSDVASDVAGGAGERNVQGVHGPRW